MNAYTEFRTDPPGSPDGVLGSFLNVLILNDARGCLGHGVAIACLGVAAWFAGGVGKLAGADVKAIAMASKLSEFGRAAEGAETAGGLNLFKFRDATSLRASGWRDGDYFLRNEWKGTPEATWRGNSSLLRQEMAKGTPIFDSYVDASGNLIPTKGFLAAERNVLVNRGWSFDTSIGAWVP